jgi:hypothetical protein
MDIEPWQSGLSHRLGKAETVMVQGFKSLRLSHIGKLGERFKPAHC